MLDVVLKPITLSVKLRLNWKKCTKKRSLPHTKQIVFISSSSSFLWFLSSKRLIFGFTWESVENDTKQDIKPYNIDHDKGDQVVGPSKKVVVSIAICIALSLQSISNSAWTSRTKRKYSKKTMGDCGASWLAVGVDWFHVKVAWYLKETYLGKYEGDHGLQDAGQNQLRSILCNSANHIFQGLELLDNVEQLEAEKYI